MEKESLTVQERKAIMVVEDDTAVRELIAEVLRDAGHEVVECADAEEALLSLATTRPALITLDVSIPLIDGFQFLRYLREHPETADLPVVFVTAAPEELRYQLSEEREWAIGKPFDLDLLLEVVERALGHRQRT